MKFAYLGLLIVFGVTACVDAQASTCRSQSVKRQFDKLNGFPNGRQGYIADHECALECGGIDNVINMQYQTVAESKAKDKWERTIAGCKKTCNATNSTPTRQVFNCK
jgi:hypothetical protein